MTNTTLKADRLYAPEMNITTEESKEEAPPILSAQKMACDAGPVDDLNADSTLQGTPSKQDGIAEDISKGEVAKVTSSAEDSKSEEAKTSDEVPAEEEQTSDRASWDHSNRKVIVQGVNKFDNAKKMKKLTEQWVTEMNKQNKDKKIEYSNVKKPPKDPWMVLTLKDDWMVEPFIDYINNQGLTNRRGDKLFAKRPDAKKRSAGEEEERDTKRQKIQEARRFVTDDEVRDVVTPLWRISQEQQLDSKVKELARNCARKIVNQIKSRFNKLGKDRNRKEKVELYDWLKNDRVVNIQDFIPVPSPIRNKCEFTFGYRYLVGEDEAKGNDETKDPPKVPSVGFMATGWSGGVSRPHVLQNISSEACAICDVVDRFLADCPLPPYDTKGHTGIWRSLTVRSSRRTKECMIIIQHSPVTGGEGDKEGTVSYSDCFESEKQRLLSLLLEAELPVPDQEVPLKVTSVFFQEYGGISSPTPEHPVQHAFGKTFLSERVGKCTYQISPGAFFQVNTTGAELLYGKVIEKVREVSSTDPNNTLLFDVCCGTGTIGIACMKEGVVGHVVGVDISEPAIADAKKNAELNGFGTTIDDDGVAGSSSKVRFVAARAEDVLSKEIGKANETNFNFVAVVDPAREGLHSDVVKTLRNNRRIRRIVYVSCNPTGSLIGDAVLLCSPPTKRYSGKAFRIESACPVDMFPLTSHYELVMTFDRIGDDDNDGGDDGGGGGEESKNKE